jgi:hypothetical protein
MAIVTKEEQKSTTKRRAPKFTLSEDAKNRITEFRKRIESLERRAIFDAGTGALNELLAIAKDLQRTMGDGSDETARAEFEIVDFAFRRIVACAPDEKVRRQAFNHITEYGSRSTIKDIYDLTTYQDVKMMACAYLQNRGEAYVNAINIMHKAMSLRILAILKRNELHEYDRDRMMVKSKRMWKKGRNLAGAMGIGGVSRNGWGPVGQFISNVLKAMNSEREGNEERRLTQGDLVPIIESYLSKKKDHPLIEEYKAAMEAARNMGKWG